MTTAAYAVPLFVYLGAKNCGFCKQYEIFLTRNRDALAPTYSKLVVADIRTWLTGPDVYLQVGKRKYSFKEFNALVGDGNGKVTYPRFWLVTADMKPARKLPSGSTFYRDVEEHKRLLARPS